MPNLRRSGQKNLEAVLKKYKIDYADYLSRKNNLNLLGYSDDQINKIVIRISSKKIFDTLCELHPVLANKFSHDQLVGICAHKGGHKSLIAVRKYADVLTGMKFTFAQISRMASHDGGSKNLAAVIEYVPELEHFQFTTDQIVDIVSHNGGSKNLKVILKHANILDQLKLHKEQILLIVSHDGGSRNLDTLIDNISFFRELQFTTEQIMQIVNHGGGSKNIDAIKKNIDALKQWGFTTNEIASMVNHDGGSKTLDAMVGCLRILGKNISLTHDQIADMLKKGKAGRNELINRLIVIPPDLMQELHSLFAEIDHFQDTSDCLNADAESHLTETQSTSVSVSKRKCSSAAEMAHRKKARRDANSNNRIDYLLSQVTPMVPLTETSVIKISLDQGVMLKTFKPDIRRQTGILSIRKCRHDQLSYQIELDKSAYNAWLARQQDTGLIAQCVNAADSGLPHSIGPLEEYQISLEDELIESLVNQSVATNKIEDQISLDEILASIDKSQSEGSMQPVVAPISFYRNNLHFFSASKQALPEKQCDPELDYAFKQT